MSSTLPTRIYRDLNIDFTVHPSTGDLVVNKDVAAIKQAVKNIVLTNIGEKPFNDYFGCDLLKSLFEPLNYMTALEIQDNIKRSLDYFEPRIILDNVNVTPDEDNYGYRVDIFFRIRNINDQQQINFFLEKTR